MILFRLKYFLAALAAVFILVAALWDSPVDEYRYSLEFGGLGGAGWPLWVERFSFDDLYSTSVGNLSGGRSADSDYIPAGAGHSIGRDMPFPKEISARWFSFRNQTFYEATTVIDNETRKKLSNWYQKYSGRGYNHSLTIGFAGQGYWSGWWVAFCSYGPCEDDPPRKKAFPLFTEVAAQEASGDPRKYVVNSEARIRDGRMPSVELPVRPQPGTGSEVLDDYKTIILDPIFRKTEYRFRFVFPDGTSHEGQTEVGKPIQWPEVATPPEYMELMKPDGSKVTNQYLSILYKGYGIKEGHNTDENGILTLDQRFVKPPAHIDFE